MEELGKKYTKIPAVKRLMREACELREPTEDYSARPLEDNLFEWHFTVRGAPATEFENGLYHGRIILPNQYPMKPPNIILTTPNGRFETNKKICLSISGYHPETWQPSWSIRTALLALIAFMPTPGKGTIGSLDYTPEERKLLAKKSQKWECPQCGPIVNVLGANVAQISSNDSHLIQRVVFKGEGAASTKSNSATEQKITVAPQSDSHSNSNNVILEDNNVEMIARDVDDHSSGFYIGERTSTVLIGLLVAAISFLVYRRLFML